MFRAIKYSSSNDIRAKHRTVGLLNGEAMVKYRNPTYKGQILGEYAAVIVAKKKLQDQTVVAVEL